MSQDFKETLPVDYFCHHCNKMVVPTEHKVHGDAVEATCPECKRPLAVIHPMPPDSVFEPIYLPQY